MADISFDRPIARDVSRARAAGASDRSWSARRTLAFVVCSSLLLWFIILAPFFVLA